MKTRSWFAFAALLCASPAAAAPELPAHHAPRILAAAREHGVDHGLLAAVCARESSFVDYAWRAEPALRRVWWRGSPGGGADWG